MRVVLTAIVIAVYVLHQDFWFWRTARPLVLGMPVGLVYHGLYCLLCSAVMGLLVKFAWPHFDEASLLTEDEGR